MKKVLASALILCHAVLLLSACTQPERNSFEFEEENDYVQEEILVEEENETQETSEPSYENLPDPVQINADFDVSENPDGSFSITTNLPDETELSLTLKGRGYIAQGKAFVEKGIAISEPFTNQGDPLFGDFTLEVLMPIPSVQSDYVKHFIGKHGPYIKPALGSIVVSKEFDVSFPVNPTSSAFSTNEFSDELYYKAPSGKKYHLDRDCCGKNAREITDISNLDPCSKCVRPV